MYMDTPLYTYICYNRHDNVEVCIPELTEARFDQMKLSGCYGPERSVCWRVVEFVMYSVC